MEHIKECAEKIKGLAKTKKIGKNQRITTRDKLRMTMKNQTEGPDREGQDQGSH